MAKYTYPAVFEKEQEGGYSIYFPDIEGCYTQSEDILVLKWNHYISRAEVFLCWIKQRLNKLPSDMRMK